MELLFGTSAEIIQWREKDLPLDELRIQAARGVALARLTGKRFIVNTHWKLAANVGAGGAHLTSRQEAAAICAELKGLDVEDFLVGQSVHSLESAQTAVEAGVDYLFLAPVFAPLSKSASGPLLGLEGLAAICRAVSIPVFALGGVTPCQLDDVCNAGAVGIAGISWAAREVAELEGQCDWR